MYIRFDSNPRYPIHILSEEESEAYVQECGVDRPTAVINPLYFEKALPTQDGTPVTITYFNHKGEVKDYDVIILGVHFGSSLNYQNTWLLDVVDVTRNVRRHFSVSKVMGIDEIDDEEEEEEDEGPELINNPWTRPPRRT